MHKHAGVGILEEFRIEFLESWHRLPNKGFFFVLLAGWLALFHFLGNSTFGYIDTRSLLYWMYNAYNPKEENPTSDDGHGNLIPFIVLGLFYWKRKELLALELRTWWPGLILVAAGLAIHIVGYVVQQGRLSVIGLFVGLYGLMGVAWGPGLLRAGFFPYFLFIFSVPFGSLGQVVTSPLRILVATIVTKTAHLGFAPDLIQQGTQLYDAQNSFHYDIAPACSGIRSLVSLLALTTIYGFLSFKSLWRRGVMVAAAFPLAVVGNVMRILFTVVVAEAFGQEAGKVVEQKFGFITFAVAIGLVLLLGKWLREPRPAPMEGPPPGEAASAVQKEAA